jgi:hypothetical protein
MRRCRIGDQKPLAQNLTHPLHEAGRTRRFGASGLTMLDLTVSDLAKRTRAGDLRDGWAGMATRV